MGNRALEVARGNLPEGYCPRQSLHPRPPEEELRRLYLGEGLGLRLLARRYGVSENTVHRWLLEVSVELRPPPAKTPVPPKAELEGLYWGQGLSLEKIGDLKGVSEPVVRKWFTMHGIPVRQRRAQKPTRERLAELYPRYSLQKAARILHTNAKRFRQWLEEDGIPVRPSTPSYESPSDEVLKHLYEEKGLSISQVAAELDTGATASAVRMWLLAAGVTFREKTTRAPTPSRAQLEQDLRAGFSQAEIAARYGLASTAVVKRWLIERGLYKPPEYAVIDDEEAVRLYLVEGWSAREIAEFFSTSHHQITERLKRARIEVPRRRPGYRAHGGRAPIPPSEGELRQRYEVEGLSLRELGEIYGTNTSTARSWLIDAGIPRRDAGWHPHVVCTDGHKVRSSYERQVCEQLHDWGLAHGYEPRLPFDRRRAADFLCNGWYVEIWGMQNFAAYPRRKQEKLDLYKKYRMPLIELEPEHFARGEWVEMLKPILMSDTQRSSCQSA